LRCAGPGRIALAFVTGLTSRPTVDRLKLREVAAGIQRYGFPLASHLVRR
jgi:hypothetical protein